MFRSNCVDTFYSRKNTQRFTMCTNSQVFFLHIAGRIQYETSYLEVRETENLRFAHHISRNILYFTISRKFHFIVNNIFQFTKEPRINLSQIVDTVNRISLLQSLCNSKYAQVSRISQFFVEVIKSHVIITYKSVHTLPDHTKSFLDDLFKRTTDRHDFTHRLHTWTDLTGYTGKLSKVPTRNLTDIVVKLRSQISRIRSSHLTNLIECVA